MANLYGSVMKADGTYGPGNAAADYANSSSPTGATAFIGDAVRNPAGQIIALPSYGATDPATIAALINGPSNQVGAVAAMANAPVSSGAVGVSNPNQPPISSGVTPAAPDAPAAAPAAASPGIMDTISQYGMYIFIGIAAIFVLVIVTAGRKHGIRNG